MGGVGDSIRRSFCHRLLDDRGQRIRDIRAQLVNDRLCDDLEGDKLANASYMRDRMIEAIDDTIVHGKAIMHWMQEVAVGLADQGKPIKWTSPVGLQCVQEYRVPAERQVNTILGRTKVLAPARNAPIRKSKQRNSIAPNIVHSFDAAHLMKTVNACVDMSFAVIHDSFGVHACDVDHLGFHLRDQFVEIYTSADWLEVMGQSFVGQLGGQWLNGSEIPDEFSWVAPPRYGDYDVEEARKSRYYFF